MAGGHGSRSRRDADAVASLFQTDFMRDAVRRQYESLGLLTLMDIVGGAPVSIAQKAEVLRLLELKDPRLAAPARLFETAAALLEEGPQEGRAWAVTRTGSCAPGYWLAPTFAGAAEAIRSLSSRQAVDREPWVGYEARLVPLHCPVSCFPTECHTLEEVIDKEALWAERPRTPAFWCDPDGTPLYLEDPSLAREWPEVAAMDPMDRDGNAPRWFWPSVGRNVCRTYPGLRLPLAPGDVVSVGPRPAQPAMTGVVSWADEPGNASVRALFIVCDEDEEWLLEGTAAQGLQLDDFPREPGVGPGRPRGPPPVSALYGLSKGSPADLDDGALCLRLLRRVQADPELADLIGRQATERPVNGHEHFRRDGDAEHRRMKGRG